MAVEAIVEKILRSYERQIREQLRPKLMELLLRVKNNEISDDKQYVLSINVNINAESLRLMQGMLYEDETK